MFNLLKNNKFGFYDYRKKIIIIIILITVLASFIYAISYLFLANSPLLALINVFFIILYLLTIIFLKMNKITFSFFWLMFSYYIHTFFISYFFLNIDAGIQNFFFAVIPISFIFFYKKKKSFKYIFIILSITLFIVVQFYNKNLPLIKLSSFLNKIFFYSSIFFSLVGFILIMLIFSDSLIKSNSKLKKQKKQLKKLNQNKNILFSIIGHDLRNPLTFFKSLVDLLTDESLSEKEAKKYLMLSNNVISSTLTLLENLLAWANSENNSIFGKKSSFNLSKTTNKNIFLLKKIAEEKEINIINSIVSPVMVYANENMISTVIRNIINNAIKFSMKKSIIRILIKDNSENIEFCVKDNGVGIKKEEIKKILGSSYYSTAGTNNEKGTGIGLKLCKNFITQNDGKLKIISSLEKGTQICFTIPKKQQFIPNQ